jgi:hypothetical protein
MKKLILPSFMMILFISGCKKNYTCSCTYSTIDTSPVSTTETDGTTATSYTKVTKKYARENCTSGKDYSTTGTGTNTVIHDYVRNCSLDGNPR